MKRISNRGAAVLLCAALAASCLCGCSSQGASGSASVSPMTSMDSMSSMNAMSSPALSAPLESDTAQQDAAMETKLVYNGSIRLEAVEYDEVLSWIKNTVSEAGGYIESQNEYSRSEGIRDDSFRTVSLTVRVPSEGFFSIVDAISGNRSLSVVSSSVSSDDVTEQYYDLTVRKDALESKIERLEDLMGQASTVSEILQIESEMTNAISELDSVKGRIARYDSMVAMSYLYIDLDEVTALTMTSHAANYGSQLAESVVKGFTDGVNLFGDIILLVTGNWLIITVAATVTVFIIRRDRRIRKAKKEAAQRSETSGAK